MSAETELNWLRSEVSRLNEGIAGANRELNRMAQIITSCAKANGFSAYDDPHVVAAKLKGRELPAFIEAEAQKLIIRLRSPAGWWEGNDRAIKALRDFAAAIEFQTKQQMKDSPK